MYIPSQTGKFPVQTEWYNPAFIHAMSSPSFTKVARYVFYSPR